ncbi:MAG TPA: uroporphyrinogen decarboxylase family protein [Clostridia bacterium]|nr:uroporphyrinogen decarboxylase family protein [Clostridia bacterium]
MTEGMTSLPAYETMSPSAKKVRDFYAIKPDAPLYQKEFGFYVLDRWIREGHLKPREEVADYSAYLRGVFAFDEPAIHDVGGLGWCEAGLFPVFEEDVLEDRGDHELVRDFAGRSVLYFKGRRSGFMPEYVDHPVKDQRSWEENIKWRMNPHTPGRLEQTAGQIERARRGAASGDAVVQRVVGGYMYLRSLIGPEGLLYMFYDDPELIHDCMRTWFELADSVIAHHQKFVSFDELFFGEDICYNHGSLISPDMMKTFLLPYYQQLYTNLRRRNIDQSRTIHFQIDTDGYLGDVVQIYRQIGCDYMSPFEVASGCDVVALGKAHPTLRMSGGIDKRVLAESPEAIDRHLEAILPAMRRRGGFIPTCDHGVPEEVSFENYMHYRKRMIELGC